jgi:hypothetical protein
VTANQDELLEASSSAAAPGRARQVLHLHGTASRPDTIMTTIGQYRAGLPRGVQQRFTATIDGKHVIVAGYSGRDLDIMPTLYSPLPCVIRSSDWLQPRRKPSRDAAGTDIPGAPGADCGRAGFTRGLGMAAVR